MLIKTGNAIIEEEDEDGNGNGGMNRENSGNRPSPQKKYVDLSNPKSEHKNDNKQSKH